VRLFLYYRASQPSAPAADRTAAESVPVPSMADVLRWDAVVAEMRRIIRIRQLSPQTENLPRLPAAVPALAQ